VWKKGHAIEEGRAAAMLLTALLIAIMLSPAAASAQAQQAVAGKELFQQHCASCHFAETRAQKIGPGLKGLHARLTFSDGKKVTDASLTEWIEAGGKNMPGFKETIKPKQIRELISYIRTL
jgi:cytochrome c